MLLYLVGIWSFLWFVCFCLLTNKWTTNLIQDKFKNKSGIEAAIAFSFFSIGTFVSIYSFKEFVLFSSLLLTRLESFINCLSYLRWSLHDMRSCWEYLCIFMTTLGAFINYILNFVSLLPTSCIMFT